jgi:hypothetical protein
MQHLSHDGRANKIDDRSRLWILSGILAMMMNQAAFSADEKLVKKMHLAELRLDQFACTHEGSVSPILSKWMKLMDLEKRLLTLECDHHAYSAQSVYISKNPRDGFDFTGLMADDTAHTLEGQAYHSIPCLPGVTLKINLAWKESSLSRCDFYLGDPGRMVADGYRGVIKLNASRDKLRLPGHIANREYLLFAIIKPVDGDYHKFVFVVHPQKSDKQ